MTRETALNAYLNADEEARLNLVKGFLTDIQNLERDLSGCADAFIKRSQIRYSSEWIDKILSGQKTMTIRRTQYPCGMYDVVEDSTGEVRGQIEVVKVEKWEHTRNIPINDDSVWFFTRARDSGFETLEDYYAYHRSNYAPVKFAHTFRLLKGDQDVS